MVVESIKYKINLISTAILCSIGFLTFSWFMPFRFPWKMVSFAALTLSAFLISRNLKNWRQVTGTLMPVKIAVLYTVSGALAGLILAFAYRNYLHQGLLPPSLQYFAFTAALIGSMEELVFRGFLQEFTRPVGVTFSILFSTLSHTFYKCFLFISPAAGSSTDIGFLLQWTFVIGIIFAISRHMTKSILPAMGAHTVFDIVVYGNFTSPPWWIW